MMGSNAGGREEQLNEPARAVQRVLPGDVGAAERVSPPPRGNQARLLDAAHSSLPMPAQAIAGVDCKDQQHQDTVHSGLTMRLTKP